MRRASHPPLAISVGSLLLVATLGGCSEWPRYSNLPADPDLVGADTDPRTLVDMAWTAVVEDEGANDSPLDVTPTGTLDLHQGFAGPGTLLGAGWLDGVEPALFEDAGCGSAVGYRSPTPESGDYAADVDFYVVQTAADGTLCGRMLFDGEGYGWDLILYELDECSIPGAAVTDADEQMLGYDLGGATGEWSHLSAADATYAIMVAAYYPPGPEENTYTLGLSLVPDAPDGGLGLCPLLEGEEL